MREIFYNLRADQTPIFQRWWMGTCHAVFLWSLGWSAEAGKRVPCTKEFYKHVLGRQTRTTSGNPRKWVWRHKDEGWVLIVSKRGASLYAQDEVDPWVAFQQFAKRLNAYVGLPEEWGFHVSPMVGAKESSK